MFIYDIQGLKTRYFYDIINGVIGENTMKRSVFEKRHGKIDFAKGANWSKAVAKKYNISLDSDVDLPAHIWHIMQNMHVALGVGGTIDVKTINNISNYLANEKRKEVRDLFLGNLDYIYFADYWGFFSQPNNITLLLKYSKQGTLKLLKRIKYLFKQYRYKPVYGKNIDDLIVEFGGEMPKKQQFATGSKSVKAMLSKKRASVFKTLFGGRSA